MKNQILFYVVFVYCKAVCLAQCVFEVFVQYLGLGKAGNLASCVVNVVLLHSS